MPLPVPLLAACLLFVEPNRPSESVSTEQVRGQDYAEVRGGQYRLPPVRAGAGLLLVFLGHECPISNAYAPELVRILREYGPRDVTCCLVYAEPDLTLEQAHLHYSAYRLEGTAILDPDCLLARWTGATKMPEAVLLSPEDRVVYRGRIDDRFYAYGKQRTSGASRDLRQALESVLSGKEVSPAVTPVIGCDIPFRLRRTTGP